MRFIKIDESKSFSLLKGNVIRKGEMRKEKTKLTGQ